MSPDRNLRSSHAAILAGILVAAVVLRILVYGALAEGPCLIPHRDSDMAFFESWSARIAETDVWTDAALHPLHFWHEKVALAHLQAHPEEIGGADVRTLDPADQERHSRAVWNRWYRQKTFHQEPLYPYALAAGRSAFGGDRAWVHVAQMLLGLIAVGLGFAVTRAYFGTVAGLCAAGLLAGSGPLLFFELQLLRATPIAVATLALLGCVAWTERHPTPRRLFTLGVALGLAALLKLHFAAFGGLVCLLWLARRRSPHPVPPRSLAWVLCGGALASLPLLVRNLVVGAPVLSSTSVGPVTFANTNHAAYPGYGWAEDDAALTVLAGIMGTSDGAFLGSMTAAIQTHEGLGSYLALLWAKFCMVWHWAEFPNNVNLYFAQAHAPLLGWMPSTFTVVATLGLIGLAAAIRRAVLPPPLLAMLLLGVAQLTAFYCLARLRCGLTAALIPLAGFGLVALARGIRARDLRFAVPAVIAAGLFAWWMQRPLPAKAELVGSAPYSNAMNNYYRPAWQKILGQRDWQGGQKLMQGAIDARPGFLDGIRGTTLPSTRSTWNITGLYAEIYGNLAACLAGLKQPGAAAAATARAKELTEAWRRVEAMLKQRQGR